MPSRQYDIVFSLSAAQQLRDLRDKQAAKKIASKIDQLVSDPQTRGKPLVDDLDGYYSVPAAGRYRVVYQIAEPADATNPNAKGRVGIVCVGIRKDGDKNDVYTLASKMLARGELKVL